MMILFPQADIAAACLRRRYDNDMLRQVERLANEQRPVSDDDDGCICFSGSNVLILLAVCN